MPNKKKNSTLIVGIIVLAIICAGLTTFFLYSHFHKVSNQMHFARRGSVTFDNATLVQTISFFNTNPTLQSLESYCQGANMIYCRFYCMRTNSSNSICSQLPMPQYRMNYSGAPQ